MKVFIDKVYTQDQIKKIENLGYEVLCKKAKDIYNHKEIEDIEVLVCYNPFEKIDIGNLNRLKLIQLTSIGIDQVPKEKVISKGITLCNNKGAYSIPIAEYIIMYILNIYKNANTIYKNKFNKVWNTDYKLEELTNKKVGFLGTGTIAKHTAKRLKAFDVAVYGINTNGRNVESFDKCYSPEYMDKIFGVCDIVISTMPSTEDTIGIINESKFNLMKEGSIFINVGRGNLVNEKDLIKYIHKFKGVALDVFEREPLPKDSELWNFDNVIITAHNSWISTSNKERTFNTVYENLKCYKNGEELKNIINIERGY